MLKIKSLLMLLLTAVLILTVYFGTSEGVIENKAIELSPVISSNESVANADTVFQADSLSNNDEEQSASVSNSQEEQQLISVQHLLDKGLDLSPFDESEILLLRKYNSSDKEVPDEYIPAWFRVFAQIVFLQGGEKNPMSMLSEKVDNNWISGNAYNQDIQHWEDISANGDVIATGVLASFYRDAKKYPKAEYHFQKLLVNVVNKDSALENLIDAAYMQNEKRAAAYAWYGKNNDIDLSKRAVRKRFNELTNKYSEQEIASELEELNSLFEDLQVNYANPELTELRDIFN
jgi:hypothetical protein